MAVEILGVLILENETASRIAVKYNTTDGELSTVAKQKEFEKELDQRAKGQRNYDSAIRRSRFANIITLKNFNILFVSFLGATVYIIGGEYDNEALLADVAEGFADAITKIVNADVNRTSLTDNLDRIFILVDELTDGKLLFECDDEDLVNRVNMRDDTSHQGGIASGSGLNVSGTFGASFGASFSGLNFNAALEQARSAVTRQLLG